jgi:hypothetical protein
VHGYADLGLAIPLDLAVFQRRYGAEVRWQLGTPGREDLTLKLWMECFRNERLEMAAEVRLEPT